MNVVALHYESTDGDCVCSLNEMMPMPTGDIEHPYTCQKCHGYISGDQNDQFNKHNEYSGYDDDPRHIWEAELEWPDTY